MKTITSLFLALSLTSLCAMADLTPPPTREVAINVTGAYVPAGFDSTSSVYVVTNMILPNSCYKWARASVVHLPGNLHEVRSYANVSQGMCLMVLIPLNKEISLGQMPSGQHVVRFVNGDGTYVEKDLIIR